MTLTNEWIEQGKSEGLSQGLSQGISQGLSQGLFQGRLETVIRLLQRRFDAVPNDVLEKIQHLSGSAVNELIDAVLDFKTIDDTRAWLMTHQ